MMHHQTARHSDHSHPHGYKRGHATDKHVLRERRPVRLTRLDRAEMRQEEALIRNIISDSQPAPATNQYRDIEKMTQAWKVQEAMWQSTEANDIKRCNVMRAAVHEMLARRWNEGRDMVEKTTPEFPGLYLSTVEMVPLDRTKLRYHKMTTDYVNMKFLMDRAIDENPHARALALLAMGPGIGGEQQLREGTVPKDWNHSVDGTPLQVIPQTWNRHHEFQKSAKPAPSDRRPLNDPTNLLYILTEKHASDNPHHALHGAILHPQTDFRPGEEPKEPIPVAIVKSTVPFYPPLRLDPKTEKRVSYYGTAEVMADLERMEPGIGAQMAAYEKAHGLGSFQSTWAKRIVQISEIARRPVADDPEHQPFKVPQKYQKAADDYSAIYGQDIFDKQDGRFIPELQEARRRAAAANSLELARSILPPGVHLNGTILPPDHEPTAGIPVKDGSWGRMRPSAIPARDNSILSEETRKQLKQDARFLQRSNYNPEAAWKAHVEKTRGLTS